MSTISRVATADDVFSGRLGILDATGMLLHHFASGGASHVHGDIAAADHNDFLADGELVSEIYVEQEIDAFVNAIEIDSRDAEIAAAVRADGDQHRVESLASQIGDREVASGSMIQFESDVARLQNLSDLRFHHIARQAVFRNSQIQHSARDWRGFENRDRIAHQREVMRRRESNRASAHDSNLIRKFVLAASFVDVDRTLRFRPVLLGQEAFQCADRNRPVDFAAAASRLAGMRTDSPANAGQRIRVARKAIGLFKASFGNQADVASGIGMRRTRHHARESLCSANPRQPSYF